MSAYLDVAGFKLRTIMPATQVDRIESTIAPGWISTNLEASSRWIDMYLAKRYRVPFTEPYPEQLKSWVARMVTARAYLVHGIPASDAQISLVAADSEKAETEIKEAANGQIGLIDLGVEDRLASNVARGGTRAYSEASPYVGYDVQRDRARREDQRRRGS